MGGTIWVRTIGPIFSETIGIFYIVIFQNFEVGGGDLLLFEDYDGCSTSPSHAPFRFSAFFVPFATITPPKLQGWIKVILYKRSVVKNICQTVGSTGKVRIEN
jgi:hypothetical protein